ncbi:MAG: DUF3391 domain-containing protein [Rhodocyclaceae bacterium]|nr:DUF3391 domain-containing protein [Rhodocyclaceae bacterium]
MAGTGTDYVSSEQLRVGRYIYLELSWLDHPFSFNNFMIRNAEQLREVRSLGLARIRIDPARSQVVSDADADDAAAADDDGAETDVDAVEAPDAEARAARDAVLEEKRTRVERNRRIRCRINACEREFLEAATVCRELSRTLFSDPAKAVDSANRLIGRLTDSLLLDRDVMVHLMNDKVAGEEVYYHSLNVAMLALLLGKALELESGVLKLIGVAALFHDIGKVDVPDKILLKKDPLTHAEEEFLHQHCAYGVAHGRTAGLSEPVLQVIGMHHERMDGSGYPNGLKGDAIPRLARLVGVVNDYDMLCNPTNLADAITPHEALSLMYAKYRRRYDEQILKALIHILGVFPPGTVVRLSNDAFAMVLSINSARPLRPVVMVYDPEIPKEEAIIVDLGEETSVNIAKAIRPNQLPRQVFDYLSPRKRVTYYFDPASGKTGGGA